MSPNWSAYGINPKDFPPCAGTKSGPALIVGCARNVHDDLEGFTWNGHAVMAINDIACFLHAPISHVYSNHGYFLPVIREMRRCRHRYKRFGEKFDLHTIEDQKVGGTIAWPWPGSGSSGLGAVMTALALGYEEITLAGMPMDNSGHYFDPPLGHPMQTVRLSNFDPLESGCAKTNKNMKIWLRAKKELFGNRVKSLSGNTRDWLC